MDKILKKNNNIVLFQEFCMLHDLLENFIESQQLLILRKSHTLVPDSLKTLEKCFNIFSVEIKTDSMWAFKSKGTEKILACPVNIKH